MAEKFTAFEKPTEEMLDFFKKRTQEHINRVIHFMEALKGFEGLSTAELAERAATHDKDKYTDTELILPYIWVTEYYRVKNEEGSVGDELQKQYDLASKATGKHVEKNLHHPEAHASTEEMTQLDLAEMVCDWSAMAEELGEGSARGWADENVGSKWKFSPEQTKTIYDLIDWLENSGQSISVGSMKYIKANGPSCPVRSKMYGGIPGGGGFGSSTEWEIGAQRAAEAAHCILGSIGKHVYGKFDWDKTLQSEKVHIHEELGLIQFMLKEYGKPLYTNRLNDRDYYEAKWVEASVNSVRKAGPALAKEAARLQQRWRQQTDVPEAVHKIGDWSYQFLINLGHAMVDSTKNWPDGRIENPYRDVDLLVSSGALGRAIEDTYKDFEPPMKHKWAPQEAPESPYLRPPPTEEEKKELERQPSETKVEHIMRMLSGEVNNMMVVNWEDFAITPWKLEEEWSDVLECGGYPNTWPCGKEGEVVATKTVPCTEGHPVTFLVTLEYELLNKDLIHQPRPSGRLEYYEPDLELKISKLKEKVSTLVCLLPEDEDTVEDCYPWNELVKNPQDFKEFVLEDLEEQLLKELPYL